jgi:hypothetical protein
MITVVYCTRETNPEHQEHLIKTSGLHKNIEVIEIINNGESLTKAYNRGLKQAKNDIVVFCHDDLTIETKQWGNKLIKLFDKNPEYAIIGVAGSKNMPVSGQWWENPKKMYGRVAHTHEGKTWLSTYSDDLGQELEEVVVCDGVWFAVDKTRIKKSFNENVEGFHFYDVTFTFENYLEGAKVGVTTAIRINHQSIGMTNEAWDKNRADFSEAYQAHLPANIKRVLRKNEKLKIIFGSISFNKATNKDKLMLDIASKLRKLGHEITIVAPLGGALDKLAIRNNVKLCSILEPPNFKLGDGKWTVQTQNGFVPSVDKTLYRIKSVNYDIIQTFDDELINHFDKLYSGIPLIQSIFSDGLFVQPSQNEKVSETITLKNDTNIINETNFIDNLLEKYNNAL